ncbi:hypothetical protein EVAR_30961_1 [Eumeta japonica]|uniref:Uncharacterized protein n=1 Tax=Eumeta variegata TaxID=151549 RepID=A0A4C1W8T2_EUMVA|nr:hypothetical protein EVAR_30961_1 [Eumeta japonica]
MLRSFSPFTLLSKRRPSLASNLSFSNISPGADSPITRYLAPRWSRASLNLEAKLFPIEYSWIKLALGRVDSRSTFRKYTYLTLAFGSRSLKRVYVKLVIIFYFRVHMYRTFRALGVHYATVVYNGYSHRREVRASGRRFSRVLPPPRRTGKRAASLLSSDDSLDQSDDTVKSSEGEGYFYHRQRDGTELGLVPMVMHKTDTVKNIFKNFPKLRNKKATTRPLVSVLNEKNFSILANKTKRPVSGIGRNSVPAPTINAWSRKSPPSIGIEPAKEATRDPLKPIFSKRAKAAIGLLGDDILTIMSILRVVKSPVLAQLAADLEKLVEERTD